MTWMTEDLHRHIKWWQLLKYKEQLVNIVIIIEVGKNKSAEDMWNDVVTQIHKVLQRTKPGRKFMDKQGSE